MNKPTLNAIRNRPRFKLKTLLTPDEFTEELRKEAEKYKSRYTALISSQESHIEVKTEEDFIWKPCLTLRAEEEPGEGYYVRGIFGPRSSIWTFFMFLYIAFGTMVILFGSLYYSLSYLKAQDDSSFWWTGIATFLSLTGILVTYIAVKIGQIKSKDQMIQLREFAENIILKYENNKDISDV